MDPENASIPLNAPRTMAMTEVQRDILMIAPSLETPGYPWPMDLDG